VGQGTDDLVGPVDGHGQGEQRQRHHQRGPDGHRQAGAEPAPPRVDGHGIRRLRPAGGAAGSDVADRPRRRGGGDEHQPDQGSGGRPAGRDDGQADGPDRDAGDLRPAGSLVQRQRRDEHGEHHLRLQHQ